MILLAKNHQEKLSLTALLLFLIMYQSVIVNFNQYTYMKFMVINQL